MKSETSMTVNAAMSSNLRQLEHSDGKKLEREFVDPVDAAAENQDTIGEGEGGNFTKRSDQRFEHGSLESDIVGVDGDTVLHGSQMHNGSVDHIAGRFSNMNIVDQPDSSYQKTVS